MAGAPVTHNVLSWMLQTMLVALVAGQLPILFRVRHPRTQLMYCHAMLVLCILLPLLQPWKVAPVSSGFLSAAAAHGRWLFGILVVGAGLQLLWLAGGLLRIRRYRIGATPLYPIPDSARAAAAITQADAVFCVSEHATGPVMLGWLAPVVLLPPSFLTLNEEAQCGIACHELLHVRRGDWLVTLIEGVAGALLWFNPGVWMLLSEARLAREQLVDAESVRLTESRESYIDALLAIARGRAWPDLAGAPSFLHRSHLTQRMQLLLSDKPVSAARLVGSFGSIAAILGATVWLACSSFPLLQAQTAPSLVLEKPAPVFVIPVGTGTVQSSRAAIGQAAPKPTVTLMPFTDPYEPVTGGAMPISPENRSIALAALRGAQAASLRHMRNTPSYRFRATFTATGSDGNSEQGEISETWLTGQKWRWSLSLGAASHTQQVHLGTLLEDQHVTILPVRALMLRNEVFWAVRAFDSNEKLRTAPVLLRGKPATCILGSAEPLGMIGRVAGPDIPIPQGRAWEEEEFCFDDASGDLLLHSPAPGIYTEFEYEAETRFHQFHLPARVRIYLAGVQAVDAAFQITDATAADDASLTPPPGMKSDPRPLQLGGPFRITAYSKTVVQPVLVRAEIDGAGNVAVAEVSAETNRGDAPPALEQVRAMRFSYTGTQRQGYIQVRPY